MLGTLVRSGDSSNAEQSSRMNLHTSYSWRRFAMIIGSCSCYSPNGPCPRLISPVFSHVWWAPDTKIELRSEWICGYVFCLPFSTIFVPNRRRSCQFSFHRTLGLLVKNDARMGLWNEVGLLKGFTKHSYFAFLSSLQVKTRFVSDILLLTRPPKTKKPEFTHLITLSRGSASSNVAI